MVEPYEFVEGFRRMTLQEPLDVRNLPASHGACLRDLSAEVNGNISKLVADCRRESVATFGGRRRCR